MIEPYTDEEWQQRLTEAVKQTLAARQARRDERAEFKRRRDYGLAQRHARKAARNREKEAMTEHDPYIVIDTSALTGPQRQQLAVILQRAAIAPSLDQPVADLLHRAECCARLLVPEELRLADMRRRLDAALTPDGRVRETWNG
ncbi:hypothetical protein [Actinoplanes sp. NPDC051411]|uniref:hypothetical protein n=1 Tax=Actinoplanes sp. NPDC051411 TaxID=3155522 RepID=UPI00342142EC